MPKLIPSKELQGFIRDNMFDVEYGANDMWMLYERIMRRDKIVDVYAIMSQPSFTKRINEWSSVEGGWLIKKGIGEEALFYRRRFHRCNLSRPELRRRVMARYRRLRGWLKL